MLARLDPDISLEDFAGVPRVEFRTNCESGLGSLQCLSAEVFGRWGEQCIELVPRLARERTRGIHVRLRRGTALLLQRRRWRILGIGLQRGVAHVIRHQSGIDLVRTQLEPATLLADLV